MGDAFNAMMDNLVAACWRLMELPLFVLLAGLAILFFISWRIALRILARRGRQNRSRKVLAYLSVFFFLLAVGLVIDHKIVTTLNEVRKVHSEQMLAQPGRMTTASYAARKLYDIGVIEDSLKKYFGEVVITEKPVHEAIGYAVIRIEEPVTHIYMAVTDLKHPDVQIAITPALKEKYLTSTFAKENNCILAINGEAGQSPRQGSGFGPWVGNWIVEGKPIMMLDNAERPFLSFDKSNKARYYPEKVTDTTLTAEKYNTIWGRFDMILDGRNLNRDPGAGQPRTNMGINKDGDLLYLMVVDGRWPGFSMGMGLKECAVIMQAFGCHQAMACDQGGSSCMYIKPLGGIVNRPSDIRERFTYTHFGISLAR